MNVAVAQLIGRSRQLGAELGRVKHINRGFRILPQEQYQLTLGATGVVPVSHAPCRPYNISSVSSYNYKPLHANDIRILALQPGHHADPIHFSLQHVALGGSDVYESLSYCWGPRREDEEIFCDHRSLRVTKNLHSALQHLRCRDRTRTLWVDALSINQEDLSERGSQVGLMNKIFQMSQRTVVWLGDEGQNSSCAIELIHQLAAASQVQENAGTLLKMSSDLPPLYDPAWSAFAALLQRPWWTRTWVVQEVAVASDVQLICGHHSLMWSDLERAVRYAVDLGFFIAYGGSTTAQAFSLFKSRDHFRDHCKPTLHEVLLQHRSLLATDPRDNVFGLLSLADQNDVAAMGISPNYHQPAEQLFTNISTALIKRHGANGFKTNGSGDKAAKWQLPSWVHNWSVSDPTVPLDSLDIVSRAEQYSQPSMPPKFRASKDTISSPQIDGKLLGLQGFLFDQVEVIGTLARTRYLRHVSHMFELFVQCHDILEQLKDWEVVARVSSREPYPTGQKRRDAYWHTLCVGRVTSDLKSAYNDPRYKYYFLLRSLRRAVRLTIRWFPRSSKDTWYNRFFYKLFQSSWRFFGMTPTKIQRIGFPPKSRLSNYRRMVRTKEGYIALVPRETRKGDWIAICKGGNLPLVVRRDGEQWMLLGETYVHGVMNGEAWDERKCKDMWFK